MARRRSFLGFLWSVAGALALAGCAAPAPGSTASPAAGASAASSVGSSPLVGSWTSTVTREDLSAGGITDPKMQNENAGRFTYTFAPDGTWTSVQESLDGAAVFNPVFRGTYVVEGATLVVTTTFPAEYADSGLHYGWSVDAAGLHLDLLDPPDPVLPLVVESHPWVRVP